MHDLVGGLLVAGEVVPEPRHDEHMDDLIEYLPLTLSHLSDWSVGSASGYG